ncbi:MAG: carbohydrate binding family 9 domain-containing protein, partial [Ignavibacterium sp.]
MISKKLILWWLSIILLLPLINNTFGQEEEEEEEEVVTEKPMLKANQLSSDFNFDGLFSIIDWNAGTDSISDLITIDPVEGGEPEAPTVVKVFTGPNDIIVAVRCFDKFPNDITAFSKARDSELAEEDHIVIVFDTFLDGRSGYVFAVNPSGARTDGLVIEQGEDVNIDWDEIWEAKTSINSEGWYAEFRIPIKSISFGKGLNEWGFNVQRRVQRLQETSRWSGAKRDHEIYQTNQAGVLTDLPEFDHGVGLSVRPSLVGRAQTISPDATTTDLEPSLDITQRIGPNILSALSINTDFAETEVDVRQINLTRFPLFFPEQRTFFLHGLDIFEFGL